MSRRCTWHARHSALQQDPPDISQAMRSTQAAIEIARGTAADRSNCELQPALLEYTHVRANAKKARDLVGEIYNRFTEVSKQQI
jgi:hypothetical protein